MIAMAQAQPQPQPQPQQSEIPNAKVDGAIISIETWCFYVHSGALRGDDEQSKQKAIENIKNNLKNVASNVRYAIAGTGSHRFCIFNLNIDYKDLPNLRKKLIDALDSGAEIWGSYPDHVYVAYYSKGKFLGRTFYAFPENDEAARNIMSVTNKLYFEIKQHIGKPLTQQPTTQPQQQPQQPQKPTTPAPTTKPTTTTTPPTSPTPTPTSTPRPQPQSQPRPQPQQQTQQQPQQQREPEGFFRRLFRRQKPAPPTQPQPQTQTQPTHKPPDEYPMYSEEDMSPDFYEKIKELGDVILKYISTLDQGLSVMESMEKEVSTKRGILYAGRLMEFLAWLQQAKDNIESNDSKKSIQLISYILSAYGKEIPPELINIFENYINIVEFYDKRVNNLINKISSIKPIYYNEQIKKKQVKKKLAPIEHKMSFSVNPTTEGAPTSYEPW